MEPPSKRLGAPLPEDLEAIVLRLLAKRPEDRFPSARAVREALEACACAGAWAPERAARFWKEDRAELLARWDADTVA